MQSIRSLAAKEIADKVMKAKFIHKVISVRNLNSDLTLGQTASSTARQDIHDEQPLIAM